MFPVGLRSPRGQLREQPAMRRATRLRRRCLYAELVLSEICKQRAQFDSKRQCENELLDGSGGECAFRGLPEQIHLRHCAVVGD